MGNRRPLAIGLILLVAWIIAGLSYATYISNHRRFTYVIVHGAFGGGWAWREVDAMLTADGQKVFRPTLTGQGERVHLANADVTLETHITDIVNTILFEDLHDVVLVGHSYGGMVITGVIDRIPDRIKSVIYLDAILPEDGESMITVGGASFRHITKMEPNAEGLIVPGWINQSAPLPHDEPEPFGAFSEAIALKNQIVARAIPTTFVLFLPKDKEAKDGRFFPFYQRAKERGWRTETFISDHNAEWSHPRQLVNLLERLP